MRRQADSVALLLRKIRSKLPGISRFYYYAMQNVPTAKYYTNDAAHTVYEGRPEKIDWGLVGSSRDIDSQNEPNTNYYRFKGPMDLSGPSQRRLAFCVLRDRLTSRRGAKARCSGGVERESGG